MLYEKGPLSIVYVDYFMFNLNHSPKAMCFVSVRECNLFCEDLQDVSRTTALAYAQVDSTLAAKHSIYTWFVAMATAREFT